MIHNIIQFVVGFAIGYTAVVSIGYLTDELM